MINIWVNALQKCVRIRNWTHGDQGGAVKWAQITLKDYSFYIFHPILIKL